MTSTDNTSKRIIQLTKFWYDYVTKDHHKDRDCHWYVEVDYAYGDKPKYTAYHSGYIADHLVGSYRDTFEEAQADLLNLIKQAIEEEREWAEAVLEDPEEWEPEQVEKAKMVRSLNYEYQ